MIRTISLLSVLALSLLAASKPQTSIVLMPECNPCPYVK